LGSSRELKNRKADPTHPATTSHPVVIADGPPVAWGATTWLLGTRFVGAWALGERFVGAGLRAPEAGLFVAIPSRYRPAWRVAGNETHVAKRGNTMDVAGKVFVVTGAGNGMGREVALALLERGAKVAGLDIKGEWLEETKALATTTAEHFAPFTIDITDRKNVLALPAKVTKALGPVDALVNVAGINTGRGKTSSWLGLAPRSPGLSKYPRLKSFWSERDNPRVSGQEAGKPWSFAHAESYSTSPASIRGGVQLSSFV